LSIASRHLLAQLHVQLVVAVEQRLDFGNAFLDVTLHVFRRVEARLLRQEADADAVGRIRFADELVVLAGHDLQQRALARAVEAEDADLRAGEKREPDVVEHAGIGRMNLPEPLHRVDVLHGQAAQYIYCVPFSGRSVSCV